MPDKKYTKHYVYSVLRYIHDIATEEFVNIGLLLYSPEENFLSLKLTNSTKRISQVFSGINGNQLRKQLNLFQKNAEKKQTEITGLAKRNESINEIYSQIAPFDDGSFKWSQIGTGISNDLNKSTESLFNRLVLTTHSHSNRTQLDEDAWKIFSPALEKRNLLEHFIEKKVSSDIEEVTFKHAWKNGAWHCMEPVSFDLQNAEAIKSKAKKILGQMVCLEGGPDKLELYLLLQRPKSASMTTAFNSARKILEKIPLKNSLYTDDQAEEAAKVIQKKINAELNRIRS